MPVHKDPSGRRWVQAETDVQGTPEEVWEAIASGPGISSWFVPTELEQRVGGVTTSNYGLGMDSSATITAWEPPHRFVAEGSDGPEEPTIATEWVVESKGGGACVVRVVHSWFSDKDDWDAQFEGHTFGWAGFFRILKVYLAHFSGQPSTIIQVMGVAPGPKEAAWAAFTRVLGLTDTSVGQQVTTASGAPPLHGIVEQQGDETWPELLIRTDAPAPGIAHLVVHDMGEVYPTLRFFIYGDRSAEAAAEQESVWQAWMASHFDPVEAPSA